MSKVTGGILGRPQGKIGGIVFAAARGRVGKLVTAREKVIPANPRTVLQVAQRSLFARSLAHVRFWGTGLYQVDWNRSVGQLPGFQSLMSIILSANDGAGKFTAPSQVPLGLLHTPDTITLTDPLSDGGIFIEWSMEEGDNGDDADRAVLFCYSEESDAVVLHWIASPAIVRADGQWQIDATMITPAKKYIVGLYFRGQGSTDGMLSKCTFNIHTAQAV